MMKEAPPLKPSRLIHALHNLFSGGTIDVAVKVARGLGDLQDRVPYSDDELIISLGNSLKFHEHSVKQRQSYLGRLMAAFGRSIADPNIIEIDGTRLQQLFILARSEPPTEAFPGKSYVLDIVTFRSLLQTATENKRSYK